MLDTSVYVGHWARGLYADALDQIARAFVVRHSAVVLSELRRGARGRRAERIVAELHRRAHVCWTPTEEDWWEAGRLVKTIGDHQGWDVTKRREFQNDALIALTARRHGATIVTANRRDFDLLARRVRVPVRWVG